VWGSTAAAAPACRCNERTFELSADTTVAADRCDDIGNRVAHHVGISIIHILHNPQRGVDVGGQAEEWRILVFLFFDTRIYHCLTVSHYAGLSGQR
jgi:hypothetical protein